MNKKERESISLFFDRGVSLLSKMKLKGNVL